MFYLENLKDLGLTRVEIESNGNRTPQAEKLFRDFADRALRRFKIADRSP
ncbi:MAG: hypothetical protein M3367_15185 [Acidobacteriota bacterium]|nr:hypothetical protein [Acidobacteriota bacterium]